MPNPAINVNAVTDRIFGLARPLVQLIAAEYAELYGMAPDSASSLRDRTAAAYPSDAALSSRVMNLLAAELESIRPGVPLWLKGGERPRQGDEVWVVTPYSSRLMGLTFTSIALQQGDAIRMGVFFRWEELQIFTGEQGDGAHLFEESLHVAEGGLTPQSSYIFHLPDVPGADPARTAFSDFSGRHGELIAYLEGAASESRPAYNGVKENTPGSMIEVARGALDFTMASGFDYPDVAAAIAIVEAAGGRCTDFSGGRAGLYDGSELFCSNPVIHQEFLAVAAHLSKENDIRP